MYTLTATFGNHDIDPFAYLGDILGCLPSHAAGQLDESLPDAWIGHTPGTEEDGLADQPGRSGHHPSSPRLAWRLHVR